MATLFVAMDRTSKVAVAQLVEQADRKTAWEFPELLLEAVPYQIHTILTEIGIQLIERPRNRNTILSRPMRCDMIFEGAPKSAIRPRKMARGIERGLTKPNHL